MIVALAAKLLIAGEVSRAALFAPPERGENKHSRIASRR